MLAALPLLPHMTSWRGVWWANVPLHNHLSFLKTRVCVRTSVNQFYSTMPLRTCTSTHTVRYLTSLPTSNSMVSHLVQCNIIVQVFHNKTVFTELQRTTQTDLRSELLVTTRQPSSAFSERVKEVRLRQVLCAVLHVYDWTLPHIITHWRSYSRQVVNV